MTVEVGESPTVKFKVTCDHPIPRQEISREDGVSSKIKIIGDQITFSKVKLCDSGIYNISCSDNTGLKAKKSFELVVTPGKLLYS